MMKRYYLLDENVMPALGDQLLRLRPQMNILKVGDQSAPPLGTKDPEILLWLENNNFSLVTRNRKSMPGHLNYHVTNGYHVLCLLSFIQMV